MDAVHDTLRDLGGRGTVLVVDDEDNVRELITVVLELEGFRVLQAEDGPTALDVAAHSELVLITLDVMMPGLDGWQVADALDQDERLQSVPRMMVSGKPLTELQQAPGAARAGAVLSKPFDFAQFVDTAHRLTAAVPEPRRAS